MKAESRQIPQKLAARPKFVYCAAESFTKIDNVTQFDVNLRSKQSRFISKLVYCYKTQFSKY